MARPLVPQRTETAGVGAQIGGSRAPTRQLILVATLLGSVLAMAPMPARAEAVLTGATVAPGFGTTATSFTFSVDYDSLPAERAEAVWAEVGSVTVTLARVSGSGHNGTWEGSSSLPAGIWPVTFHAIPASGPQPLPITLPDDITVTPLPTPTPSPTPRPTATPRPPTPPPPGVTPTPVPVPPPGATVSPFVPGPQPSPPPADDDPTPTATTDATGSIPSGTPDASPTRTAGETDAPAESPAARDPTADDDVRPRGSLLAPLLFVGGTMSLVGAAVLGRQWYVTRRP